MKKKLLLLGCLFLLLPLIQAYVIKGGPASGAREINWGAGSISADATQCKDPIEATINSGPKQYVIVCTDNDAGIIDGCIVMPDTYSGGTVTFEVTLVDLNATPAGDYDIDFSVSCRGNSDVVNSTYGTEVAADFDFDASGTCGTSACVQYELAQVTTAAATGNGTCAAGDQLCWKGGISADGTTCAHPEDVNILHVKMKW